MFTSRFFYVILAANAFKFVNAQISPAEMFEASNTDSITLDAMVAFETTDGLDSTVLSKKPHSGIGPRDEIDFTVLLFDRHVYENGKYQPQLVLFFAPESTAVEDLTTTDNGFQYFEASTVAWMKEKTHANMNHTYFTMKTLTEDGSMVSDSGDKNVRMGAGGGLRLKRSDGKITSYYSFDAGETWTQIGFDYELPTEYQTGPLKIGYRVLREYQDEYRIVSFPIVFSGGEVNTAAISQEISYFDGTNVDVNSGNCGLHGCTLSGTSDEAVMLSTAVFADNISFKVRVTDRQIFGTGYQAGIWLFFAPESATIADIATFNDDDFKDFAIATIGDKIHATIIHTWMDLRSQTDSGTAQQSGGDNYKNADGYIKLERIGGVIKAWISPNGNAYRQIGVDKELPSNLANTRVKLGVRIQKNWAPRYDVTLTTDVESPATPIPYGALGGSCGTTSDLGLKCAHLSGDPHLSTFDGVRYDCQGRGEFVLTQNDHISIQGRFMPPHSARDVTVMRALAFSVCDGPVIQVSVPEEVPTTTCSFKYHLDGVEVDLSTLPSVKKRDNWLFFEEKGSRSMIAVSVYHSPGFGCMMSAQTCIPDETEGVVGLFGTPNGDRADDWTVSTNGNQITVPAADDWESLLFKPAYDYCVNWCVGSPSSSLFTYDESEGKGMSYYNIDCPVSTDEAPEPYDDSLQSELENVPNDVREACGNDVRCQIEGVIGGLDDSLAFKTAETNMDDVEAILKEVWPNSTLDFAPVPAPGDSAPGGSVNGDPHFKTWAGEAFDFHGICDLVLLANQGFKDNLGMDIHIRTKKIGSFSYVSNAVLRIGEDTLEVMGGKDGSSRYWINGVAGEERTREGILEIGISGFPILFRPVQSRQSEFTVDLGNDEMIVLKTWREMVRVDIQGATKENFGNSMGMLGTFSSGKKVARDRTTILNDMDVYGQEWQVLAMEPKLFHSSEGPQQPAEKCVLPSATEKRRHLRESSLTQEDAERACSRVSLDDFDLCVFDVMATNELDVAGAY